MSQFFELPDGKIICFNPGGRFHGWLLHRHPDGQFVSEKKLSETMPPHDPLFVTAPIVPSSPTDLISRSAALAVIDSAIGSVIQNSSASAKLAPLRGIRAGIAALPTQSERGKE